VQYTIQSHQGHIAVVARLSTFTGTHTGEIFGRAATGKKVIMTVIDIVRLENGKYVDHWGKNDLMQVIQSL
jgi:predicted ester cyclase